MEGPAEKLCVLVFVVGDVCSCVGVGVGLFFSSSLVIVL
jgi:hypothetical protein